MRHYLNVCDVDGAKVQPVDIITFGSPCQDLSVAGKRAGLKHKANGDEETTRSGLFMEAVRIIKEMRGATNGNYPTFALWENVPGAFSSNKGEDFRVVLEELAKIKDEAVVIPQPARGKWATAGGVDGDGWSLAWRTVDAQYHGVPQRRRRILLVADFTGQRAREISFKCEGLPGYFTESGDEREGTAAPTTASAEGDGGAGGRQLDGVTVYSVENHPADSRVKIDKSGKVQTLTTRMGTGGGNVPMVMHPTTVAYGISPYHSEGMKSTNPKAGIYEAETSRTLDPNGGNPACNQGGIAIVEKHPTAICLQGSMIGRKDKNGPQGDGVNEDISFTLNTIDRHAVVAAFKAGNGAKARSIGYQVEVSPTIASTPSGTNQAPAVVYGVDCRNGTEHHETQATLQSCAGHSLNCGTVVRTRHIVRRLMPTECARLQGFPDEWGHIQPKKELTDEEFDFWLRARNTHAAINGKPVKDYTRKQILTWYNKLWTDSAEYKMWGNGVALPCVRVPLHNMAKEGAKTLGSLFDGSGGFPLAGALENILPLWASEIEPYPLAVTRERFPAEVWD